MNPIKSYTLGTFRKLCSSLIPETPELAAQYGEEQIGGAESVNLEEALYAAFNNLSELNRAPFTWLSDPPPTLPISPVVALLLDVTALEYILRNRPSDALEIEPGTGPFGWLSAADRLSVIDFLAEESLAQNLNACLDTVSPYSGFLDYLVRGITAVPVIAYYGEWSGYDQPGGGLIPEPDSFTGSPQSWDQTGFPGLKAGYSDFLGYEVEEFKENEY